MKIVAIRAHPVSVPLGATYWVGNASFSTATVIVVQMETDDGVTGLATLHGRAMKTATAMLNALSDHLRGDDPMAHEALWAKVFALSTKAPAPTSGGLDPALFAKPDKGALMTALAGIDIAAWDIKGKALGQPVWRLLGAGRTEVPAYVTGGYYRSDRESGGSEEAALEQEMTRYLALGYTAVKMKVGAAPVEVDERRVAAARRALGPQAKLMVDGNGAYSLADATRAIAAFEPHDIAWFEEPLHWYDSVRALGKLAQRTRVPIASGESELHAWACRDLVDLGGVRIMQFDGTLAGGATEWLRVAAYCHLQGVAVSTHHEPHIHGHLAAAAPNAISVETFPDAARDPLWAHLYTERADVRDGKLILTDRPGFGFDVDWGFVDKHRA